MYLSGQTDITNRLLTVAYWNGTAFVNLTNTLNFGGTGGTIPTAYDEFLSNSVPLNAIINNTVVLRLSLVGSVRVFYNWLSLSVLSSSETLQDLKGSSEMHITNLANATTTLFSNITVNINTSEIPSVVWNYSNRSLTYYPSQVDMTNYSKVSNITAFDVWNYVARYTHGVILN
jgi:hypothetical protein